MKHPLYALPLFLVLSATASAQDFGRKWMDDVTNELNQERGPLDPLPVDLTLYGGLLYAYDTNIFLEEKNEDSSSILIPWARARVDYADTMWSASADLLAAYKEYFQEDDVSDDEERFYARIGYAGSDFTFQIVDIYRHESDPTGAVFADRVERIVNHLHADFRLDLTPAFALEWNGDLGLVRMLDADFDKIDNFNYRTDLGVAWRSPYGYDLIAQAGILGIDYRYETDTAPDVDGFFVRGGIRGELLPRLKVTALAGWTTAESDDFLNGQNEEADTGDVAILTRYEATEQITFHGQYHRQITFAGGIDPFNIVNRFVAIGEYAATEQLDLRGRIQFDDSHSSLGVERDFVYLGASADYTVIEQLILSLGVTYRSGEVEEANLDWDDVVLTAGAAYSY